MRNWGTIVLGVVATSAALIPIWHYKFKSDDAFLNRCRELRNAEDWNELRAVAADWISTTSRPGDAWMFLADAQAQSGDPLQAIQSLLSVPEDNPKAFEALIIACNMQFDQLNRPLDGVETLHRMIRMRPSSISSRQRLIFFYAVTLQRSLMLSAIYDAIDAGAEPPDAYVYLMLSDHLSFTNGFAANTEWMASDPDNVVFQAARVIQAIDDIESRDDTDRTVVSRYLDTIGDLRKKHPENQTLLRFAFERAVIEFDLARAEELAEEVSADTQDSVLLRLMGWLAFQQGDFERSEDLLSRSIDVFPLDWHTWHELAACRRRLKNPEGAKMAEEAALFGKAIHKEIRQLEDASRIPTEALMRLLSYATQCGDKRITAVLTHRLVTLGQTSAKGQEE
jgi:tetratricopeptide (TPR) repeat protein